MIVILEILTFITMMAILPSGSSLDQSQRDRKELKVFRALKDCKVFRAIKVFKEIKDSRV